MERLRVAISDGIKPSNFVRPSLTGDLKQSNIVLTQSSQHMRHTVQPLMGIEPRKGRGRG